MPIIKAGYVTRQVQASRTTAHWQRIRTARLNHDRHQCQLRYPGCTHTATSVHLDPALNGNHMLATLHNTISCCRRCHSRRGGL